MQKKGRLLGNGAREARKANAVDICSTIRLKNRLRTPVLGLLHLEYTISGGWGVPSKALQEMGKGSTEPWLPEGGLQEQPSNHLTVLRLQRPGAER